MIETAEGKYFTAARRAVPHLAAVAEVTALAGGGAIAMDATKAERPSSKKVVASLLVLITAG
jgi:hypothetical protein